MTTKRKKGPTSTCTQSTANRVLDLLAQGKTPIQIEKLPGMPRAKTIYAWAQNDALVTDERAENPDELTALDRALIAYRNAREAHTAPKVLPIVEHQGQSFRGSTGSTKSEHRAEKTKIGGNQPNQINKAKSNPTKDNPTSNAEGRRREAFEANVVPFREKVDKDTLNRLEADCRFSRHYAHAREIGLWIMSDELLAESDDDSKDYDQNGNPNHAAIQRSKLRVDTRKWLLARRLSGAFGDRMQAEETKAPDVVLTGYDVDL